MNAPRGQHLGRVSGVLAREERQMLAFARTRDGRESQVQFIDRSVDVRVNSRGARACAGENLD